MGRPPIGETAMTGAERVRRYRLAHGHGSSIARPKPDAAAQERISMLEAELALAAVEVAKLRAEVAQASNAEALLPLTRAEMQQAMQKRYDLAVKKARLEVREELRQEVYKECDVFVRHIKERAERADRILASYKGVMSKSAFRKIKACLHPDHNTFKYAAEALQTFSELEIALVKPDDPVYGGPPLPKTAADLMARRRRG